MNPAWSLATLFVAAAWTTCAAEDALRLLPFHSGSDDLLITAVDAPAEATTDAFAIRGRFVRAVDTAGRAYQDKSGTQWYRLRPHAVASAPVRLIVGPDTRLAEVHGVTEVFSPRPEGTLALSVIDVGVPHRANFTDADGSACLLTVTFYRKGEWRDREPAWQAQRQAGSSPATRPSFAATVHDNDLVAELTGDIAAFVDCDFVSDDGQHMLPSSTSSYDNAVIWTFRGDQRASGCRVLIASHGTVVTLPWQYQQFSYATSSSR